MNQTQKRQHWAEILEQQKHSQLTIKQFCIEKSIPNQTFYYWVKKLNEESFAQQVQSIVVSDLAPDNNNSVILSFANGMRAELPASLSPIQIQHWLKALQ